MTLASNIQIFLKQKLKEHNLRKKDFAKASAIPYSSVITLISAGKIYPDLKNILKIANYFNCSIDEVLGRKEIIFSEKTHFIDLSLDDINNNLKNFLNDKLLKHSLKAYQLGKICGFSEDVIVQFLKKDRAQRSLGSGVVTGIANYFKVSIDEMIGRVRASNQEQQPLEKDK